MVLLRGVIQGNSKSLVLIEFYQTAKESDLLTAKDVVVVSTIHRSKGLEFENVILPSVTDDVFPNFFAKKKINSDDDLHSEEGRQLLEEQKRLLYVALTRAKKTLMIGSYDLRAEQVTWKYPKPYQLSRFMGCVISHFERI